MMMHRITELDTIPDTSALVLKWSDGTTTVKDLYTIMRSSEVFAALTDPTLFATAHIINGGRAIAWGDDEGVDYCADALWMETHERTVEAVVAAE